MKSALNDTGQNISTDIKTVKDKFYCLEPFLLTIQSFKYMVINGNEHDSNLVYIYKLGLIKTHKTPCTERDIKPDTLVTSEFIMYNSN